MSDSNPIYFRCLLSFLKKTCSAGRNTNEVAQLKATLETYTLLLMPSDNVVIAIARSSEWRRTLLDFSSNLGYTNHPLLRAALRADDKALAKLIASIFNAEAEAAALALEGESAQRFLDVVHDTLTRGLFSQEESQQARRLIRRLADSCDKLPSSLFITGVTGREDHPTFGGGFGDIYRATHTGKSVALKHMRHFLQGSDLRRIRSKFCREALVWKDLNHPHILAFIGIDREHFPSSLCMVSPWMEHGTVLKYLNDHGHASVNRLLYEIAQGLQYLHSRNIVHGYLRGTNILITQDWTACLADFGLSTFADANPSSTLNQGGSLHWMAPELLDPGRFGTKFCRTPATDVYAFGCVCLELYTGRHPFFGLTQGAALLKIINGVRPERPSGSPEMSDNLWQDVTTYWADQPTHRPAAAIVVRNMEEVIDGITRHETPQFRFPLREGDLQLPAELYPFPPSPPYPFHSFIPPSMGSRHTSGYKRRRKIYGDFHSTTALIDTQRQWQASHQTDIYGDFCPAPGLLPGLVSAQRQ